METNKHEILLQHHGVRPTAVRLLILKGIEEFGTPFSLEELYVHFATVDRSTIFRALTLFEEKHLLHSFEDGSGKRKYCFSQLRHHAGSTHHAHATCRVCGRTFCVPAPSPAVDAPAGFCVESVDFIITGVCSQCSNGE